MSRFGVDEAQEARAIGNAGAQQELGVSPCDQTGPLCEGMITLRRVAEFLLAPYFD